MSVLAVGAYLKVLREGRGLSQEEAASKATISIKTLGRWEKGKNEPTVSNLKRLVRLLDGSISDAISLLIREDATLDEARDAAERWLRLTDEERQRIDAILESTSPDEVAVIVGELRQEYRRDAGLVTFLRGVLIGWRERGSAPR